MLSQNGKRLSMRANYIFIVILAYSLSFVLSQDCSAARPCATGCCSQWGYCGIGEEFCGAGCLASCDFKLGCDVHNPCPSGCCSKFGFCGLGPDYCSDEVCVAGCGSKSYCDPGYGPEWAEYAHCPLNVCCSKWGYCGITEEFCGDTKVERKACAASGQPLQYVVGYYEGWGPTRPCNDFWPEQIPRGVYTHINFAFALIDPVSFEIRPASYLDTELYTRLTDLKKIDPYLKVFIAIGGWAFNNPGPTEQTFSDLARSEENQKKFFQSLTSFLATYNFDGVDIDWEYPQTKDRNGRDEDFVTFPKFIRNLKNALDATGGRNGLTLTLPASYWYLRHFDIVELVKYVEFFNIMSYDLHGPWEKGNKWTGEYLNAHTNLTEIDTALDLLWRNHIDPAKVVLGLAFYGRAFTVANSGCKTPGNCLFASGARALRCSHEISIMLNSEIDQIIDEKDLAPTLYVDAAVKVISWDDQWVAYDDAETIALKVEFSKRLCLGGVMVWAISHDTVEAKYSKALSRVTNRPKPQGGIFYEADPLKKIVGSQRMVTIEQCRWTNCNDNCPSGWKEMTNTLIPGAVLSRDELDKPIQDETACDGDGFHKFCCPVTTYPPSCGWTSRNNGKCDGACPSGYTEVGSSRKHCSSSWGSNSARPLCCTYDNVNLYSASTSLYGNCFWAGWPDCDSYSCPADGPSLTSSTSKNGDAICNPRTFGGYWPTSYQKSAYCCRNSDPNKRWKNCAIPTDSSIAAGRTLESHCSSSCSSGQKTRVSLDLLGSECFNKGGGVPVCCDSGYAIDDPTDTTDEAALREALTSVFASPQCLDESVFGKRSEFDESENGTASHLAARGETEDTPFQKFVKETIADALGDIVETAASIIIDEVLKSTGRKCSSVTAYRVYKQSRYNLRSMSKESFARQIMCSVDYMDCLLCGNCKQCVDGTCGGPRDPHASNNLEKDCADAEDGDGDKMKTFEVQKREEVEYDAHGVYLPKDPRNPLQKRAGKMEKEFLYAPRSELISYFNQGYTSAGQWHENDPIYDRIFDYEDEGDCFNVRVTRVDPTLLPILLPQPHYFQTEHIIEFQGMKTFFEFLSDRALAGGSALPVTPYMFFQPFFNSHSISAAASPVLPIPFLQNPDANQQIPSDRIMEALGSTWNNGNFVLLRDTLNGMKSRLWASKAPVIDAKMTIAMNTSPGTALSYIRRAIAVTYYLNTPIVNGRLVAICHLIRQQLVIIEDTWQVPGPNREVRLSESWDEFIRFQMSKMVKNANDFAERWLAEIKRAYEARADSDPDKLWVLNGIRVLETHRQQMVQERIRVAGFT